jgi:hypothetical protein
MSEKTTIKNIPMEEKKKVLIVYCSSSSHSLKLFSQIKGQLIKNLRNESIKISNENSLQLELEKMIYYFFDKDKRNLKSFQEKCPSMDFIYLVRVLDIKTTISNFLPLVENDSSKVIEENYLNEDTFMLYKNLLPKTVVFIINRSETDVEKIEIWEHEFTSYKHFRTKDEAVIRLKERVTSTIESNEKSIKYHEKKLEESKKLLNKLNKTYK